MVYQPLQSLNAWVGAFFIRGIAYMFFAYDRIDIFDINPINLEDIENLLYNTLN